MENRWWLGILGGALIGAAGCGAATGDTTAGGGGESSNGGSGAESGGEGSESSNGGSGSQSAADRTGEDLFWMPLTQFSTYACGTCHSIEEPAMDLMRRPGHALGEATARPSFKDGQLDDIIDAVNSCRAEWMAQPEPWDEDTPEWQRLRSFLEDQNDGAESETITYTIVEPSADTQDYEGGDFDAGQQLFNDSCALCHGEDGEGGTGRAPALPAVRLDALGATGIARRVRLSGPSTSEVYEGLTGGGMPFWSEERLSEQELKDVILFLLGKDDVEQMETGEQATDLRECGSTHAKVGQQAVLVNRVHGIGGTATIVDDCTIRIDDFTFDGAGINVQIYGGLGGAYASGFGMSDNLVGPAYESVTLTVQLPEDRTLDDLDGVSVWCVPVGIDFGSGLFQDP